MKGNHLGRKGRKGDSAVSPVIAVILMVAITVVLAATVYVWVSGFTDTGDQAPSANFRHVSCDETIGTDDTGENNVTVKLTSGGPLQQDDTKVILFNRTDDSQEATTDPLSDSGTWATGSQKVVSENSGTGDYVWDSALTQSLGENEEYRLDFIHKPTESSYASLPFTC
jgi:flagellin-like protein